MKIRLLAFASASDALGTDALELTLPEGTTVGELEARLCGQYPPLRALWPRLAVAVNSEVANRHQMLQAEDEVALLPPVSGGRPAVASLPRITDQPIDVAAITAAVEGAGRGAVVLFLGTVRDHHGGRPVEGIVYSAYRPMAEARLARIIEELEAAEEDLRVRIVHRLGTMAVGEASVAIAAASPHRAAAYEASRIALERLKAEVPIWKRERYADGEVVWREEESLKAGENAGKGMAAPETSVKLRV
jgi:molybdopterin synthase catalytic subunit